MTDPVERWVKRLATKKLGAAFHKKNEKKRRYKEILGKGLREGEGSPAGQKRVRRECHYLMLFAGVDDLRQP